MRNEEIRRSRKKILSKIEKKDFVIQTKVDKKLSKCSLDSARDLRGSDNSSPFSPPAVLN